MSRSFNGAPIIMFAPGVGDRGRNRSIRLPLSNRTASLEKAQNGIYSIKAEQEATRNYQAAGGQSSFSEYDHSKYDASVMDVSLKKRIIFANHNLVTIHVFGEMHLVFCRNVLIESLELSERRFRSLIEKSADLISVIDAERYRGL